MMYSARLQLLTCLIVYVSSAHAIMVKFGTKGGPIEPPVPTPELPAPQPYRVPAPVWEERSDTADPNAKWRPQLFVPQPRYTQVIFNPAFNSQSNLQRFVNSYRPTSPPVQSQPQHAEPIKNYFTPSQILSSQSLPGYGIRYFLPLYVKPNAHNNHEEEKQNTIENDISNTGADSPSDLHWKLEKDASKRVQRRTLEGTARQPYQWPVYVPRHQ